MNTRGVNTQAMKITSLFYDEIENMPPRVHMSDYEIGFCFFHVINILCYSQASNSGLSDC